MKASDAQVLVMSETLPPSLLLTFSNIHRRTSRDNWSVSLWFDLPQCGHENAGTPQ